MGVAEEHVCVCVGGGVVCVGGAEEQVAGWGGGAVHGHMREVRGI